MGTTLVSSNTTYSKSVFKHPNDPELICVDKTLPATIEDDIKEGFFELR